MFIHTATNLVDVSILSFRRVLYVVCFFGVFPRRLRFKSRRFGTLYQFHLPRVEKCLYIYTRKGCGEEVAGPMGRERPDGAGGCWCMCRCALAQEPGWLSKGPIMIRIFAEADIPPTPLRRKMSPHKFRMWLLLCSFLVCKWTYTRCWPCSRCWGWICV